MEQNNCRWCSDEGLCFLNSPDSLISCTGKCNQYLPVNKVIEGVGKDAEIETNANGGKQSKSPMAMHLLSPQFLKDLAENQLKLLNNIFKGYEKWGRDVVPVKVHLQYNGYTLIKLIASFMLTGEKKYLVEAIDFREPDSSKVFMIIAKVMKEGAERYEANNWRLIPEEEHINHALIHLLAYMKEDTQDDHYGHFLCRLMMAYSTEKSENFDYNKYKSKAVEHGI